MKPLILLGLMLFVCGARIYGQTVTAPSPATETIQQSQSPNAVDASVTAPPALRPASIRIPAGTPIEVEAAYTVDSLHVKPGESISFRVLIPVVVGGMVAIDKGALVTAKVTVAKRGGHWGKSGRLAWIMQDVLAVDNTRVVLAPETSMRVPDWGLLKDTNNETAKGEGSVKGTSHKGEVATRTIVAAAIFPPLAPLALMHGFRRGENAVLPEGKRFVAVVRSDSSITIKEQR